MDKGRVLGRVPDDREVKERAEPAAERSHAREEHGTAHRYKQAAKSDSMGRAAEADDL